VSAVVAVMIPPPTPVIVRCDALPASIGALVLAMGRRHLRHALLESGRPVGDGAVLRWDRLDPRLAARPLRDPPRAPLAGVQAWGLGLVGVGFFVAPVFLAVGCRPAAIPAIIIDGTTLRPLAAPVGMHPVSFAIIGIVVPAFGHVTRPSGPCLPISCAIAKLRLRYSLEDMVIMLDPTLLVLAMPIVRPEIALVVARWTRPDLLR
jgi:TRAP-type C4-dicarboxylate transport system permease large subunit